MVVMRYATNHNFMGRRVLGYNARRCILTKEAAASLKGLAKMLTKMDMF